MSRQANILFIHSSFSGNDFGLRNSLSRDASYQQLICSLLTHSIYTKEGFESLGRQLAAVANQAYLSRQMDAVEKVSQLILALPVSDGLRCIARYYHALRKKDNGDFEGARHLLERVLEEAPLRYKARALHSIGATYLHSSQVEASRPFFLEAGKAAFNSDLFTLVGSQKMIAVARSIDGDHKQALSDLERLFPMVRAIAKDYPAFYYEFLNSLAVELGEVGRISEAEAAVRIALASPFAAAYPEFSETRDEIAAKRISATHSVVAVSATPHTETLTQPQLERKTKRINRLKLSWPARRKTFVQTSLTAIAACKSVAHNHLTQITLDRVRKCVKPRSPPAFC